MEIHTRAPVEQLLCQNDYMWQGGLRVGASVTEQCADSQPWVSRRWCGFLFFFFFLVGPLLPAVWLLLFDFLKLFYYFIYFLATCTACRILF